MEVLNTVLCRFLSNAPQFFSKCAAFLRQKVPQFKYCDALQDGERRNSSIVTLYKTVSVAIQVL